MKADKVSFQYAPSSLLILNELTFHSESGEIVAVLGQNGSGKSTLGKLIAGILVPTAGRVVVNDLDISKLPLSTRVRTVSYIPQVGRLSFVTASLEGECRLWARKSGVQTLAEHHLTMLFDKYCIPKPLHVPPLELTANEAWRFLLLLIDLTNPPVVFFDELPSTVNEGNVHGWKALISRRREQGYITYLSSHRTLPAKFEISSCVTL